MRSRAFALWLALIAPAAAAGLPPDRPLEVRFSGPSAVDALCACLLDARRRGEAEGRLDFTAEVEYAATGTAVSAAGTPVPATGTPVDVTARIWIGSPHTIGRITFAGQSRRQDATA